MQLRLTNFSQGTIDWGGEGQGYSVLPCPFFILSKISCSCDLLCLRFVKDDEGTFLLAVLGRKHNRTCRLQGEFLLQRRLAIRSSHRQICEDWVDGGCSFS